MERNTHYKEYSQIFFENLLLNQWFSVKTTNKLLFWQTMLIIPNLISRSQPAIIATSAQFICATKSFGWFFPNHSVCSMHNSFVQPNHLVGWSNLIGLLRRFFWFSKRSVPQIIWSIRRFAPSAQFICATKPFGWSNAQFICATKPFGWLVQCTIHLCFWFFRFPKPLKRDEENIKKEPAEAGSFFYKLIFRRLQTVQMGWDFRFLRVTAYVDTPNEEKRKGRPFQRFYL